MTENCTPKAIFHGACP